MAMGPGGITSVAEGTVIRVVWPPHVDYLRAVGPGTPDVYGFARHPQQSHRWWRWGWWAQTMETEHGVITCADAEAGSRTWPQPFSENMHLTRVDIACDITGGRSQDGRFEVVKFLDTHRLMFAGRGRRTMEEVKGEARTIYIGSRTSPLMLRIYLKTAAKNLQERDRQVWLENGWDGRSEVWRIEYEFKRRAISPFESAAGFELPAAMPAMWADALARIRMCAADPKSYCEQNKAPTHAWWKALGSPCRKTRPRRRDLTEASAERPERFLRDLDRLASRAGVPLLPLLVARLKRIAKTSGAKENVHNGEQERAGSSP